MEEDATRKNEASQTRLVHLAKLSAIIKTEEKELVISIRNANQQIEDAAAAEIKAAEKELADAKASENAATQEELEEAAALEEAEAAAREAAEAETAAALEEVQEAARAAAQLQEAQAAALQEVQAAAAALAKAEEADAAAVAEEEAAAAAEAETEAARAAAEAERAAATRIEAWSRGRKPKQNFNTAKKGISKLKLFVRDFLLRKQLKEEQKQKAFKILLDRSRARAVGKLQRTQYLKDKKDITQVQAVVRGKLARKITQKKRSNAAAIAEARDQLKNPGKKTYKFRIKLKHK
jgi:hypothetical protein